MHPNLWSRNKSTMDTRPNEYQQANDRATEMKSLSELTQILEEKGFTEQFRVKDSTLISPIDGKGYRPDEVKAVNFYRFEGISDPDDMSVLYAIETIDGRKGTLIDAYGTYADTDIDDFVKTMEIFKKTEKKDKTETDQ